MRKSVTKIDTKRESFDVSSSLDTLNISINGRKVFQVLLERGRLKAKTIASVSGVRRELTYRALDELESADLIKKNVPDKGVALFEAVHPEFLIEKLRTSRDHIDSVRRILTNHMSSLTSTYNRGLGLPNVEFKEGIEGLKYLYKDVIATGEPVRLVRSPLDIKRADIQEIIHEHRAARVKHDIHTQIVTSFNKRPLKESIVRDKEYLVERHIIPRGILDIPAQILIYGEKVALTSFEGELVTTIIENRAIKETFEIIFSILWNLGRTARELLNSEERK